MKIVRRLQENVLGFGLEPFEGLDLARVRELAANGTIRRFGAIVNHRQVGFVANALTAWAVPAERIDAVGAAFAASPAVSHCYRREQRPGWPYALYAMVHAKSGEELADRIRELSKAVEDQAGAAVTPLVLPTRREFKKASMRYFVEDNRADRRA